MRLTWPCSPLRWRDRGPLATGDAATRRPHVPTAVPTGCPPAPRGLGRGPVPCSRGLVLLPCLNPACRSRLPAESVEVPIPRTNPPSLFLLLDLVVPFLGGRMGSIPPLATYTRGWLQPPRCVPLLHGLLLPFGTGGKPAPGLQTCRVWGPGAAAVSVRGRPRGRSSSFEGMETAPQLQDTGGRQPHRARQGQRNKVPRKGQRSIALRAWFCQ